MGKVIDLTGQRFGKLTVIERSKKPENTKRTCAFWLCQCDCGNVKVISSHDLICGVTKSCGCFKKKENKSDKKDTKTPKNIFDKYPKGELSVINKMIYQYRRSAEKRDISFNLSKERFIEIITRPCFYCGEFDTKTNRYLKIQYQLNGIDRINSDLGYDDNNVVPCCRTCNIAKQTMIPKEFLDWIADVYNHSIIL